MIEYRDRILRVHLRKELDKLFVFGDNLAQKGYGGQAKEMRGEPNAVGIPTKIAPLMTESSFFSNTGRDLILFDVNSRKAFDKLREFKGTIVWPSSGIGTGLAELRSRAPKIWRAIEELRKELETT